MTRVLWVSLLVLGLVAAALVYFVPLVAAIGDVVRAPDWSDAALGPRRLSLLWNSILLAAAGALGAQLLGALLAGGLAARGWAGALARWAALFILLVPPYVYAYAWSLPLLPAGIASFALTQNSAVAHFASFGRAVLCLSCWTAPAAAWILAVGWRQHGRLAYRLALLDSSGVRAVLRAAAPVMLFWFLLSLSITGALGLTEFCIPSLCFVQTWNTEVLDSIQSAGPNGRALLLAWPLIALLLLVGAIWWPWRKVLTLRLRDILSMSDLATDPGGMTASHTWRSFTPPVLVILLLLTPFALLIAWLQSPASVWQVKWAMFDTLRWGLLWALLSAVVAIALGLFAAAGVNGSRWLRWAGNAVFVVAALAALAPPGLVGDSFAAAYLHVPAIYDHGLIVSLVGAARFGLVGILLLRNVAAQQYAELIEMARTDRATVPQRYCYVLLPQLMRPALTAGLIVMTLALGEVAAVQLVAPAGVGSVGVFLLNMIHFGRSDEIIAACLQLGLLIALFVVVTMGRSSNRRAGRAGR